MAKGGKLFGKSASAKKGIGKAVSNGFPAGVVPTAPASSGNADVVKDRLAQVTQGKMEQGQLKKNKSKGLTIRGGKKR